MKQQNSMAIMIVLSLCVVALGILAIVKSRESSDYQSRLDDLRNTYLAETQRLSRELREVKDSAAVLRETVNQLALIKQMAEQRRQDSLDMASNEQERIDRINLSKTRIEKFAGIFMKGVSPTSHQDLEVIIDTSAMTYDPYLKNLSVPFTVKWLAYKYGIFVNESSKSLHEFQGRYSIGANYNEHIESRYQNYALREGIRSRADFEKLVSGLNNLASLMESIERVDRAFGR